MSTIKSRWKWIRRQAILILVLAVIALFPSLPRRAAILVERSGLYDSGKMFIQERIGQERFGQKRIGQRFEESTVESSVKFDTIRRPESDIQLAADQGDHLAQYHLLKNAGVDLTDLDGYLQTLYENQSDPIQTP